jgi:hypothetical protein
MLLTVLAVIGVGISTTLLLTRSRASAKPMATAPDLGVGTVSTVRSAFDQMLVDEGLLTVHQLELIRHGTRSHGVITGMRATGERLEDYREVELDLMVRRPGGGQFAVHETALIPASSMTKVAPGSVIDTYFRPGHETEVAVSVPPA